MRNTIRHGLGGFVMSPFGDFGDGVDFTSIINTIGQVVNTVGQVTNGVINATRGNPSAQPGQGYAQSQYGYGLPGAPNLAMPQKDNTLLYVAGGGMALLLAMVVLTRK